RWPGDYRAGQTPNARHRCESRLIEDRQDNDLPDSLDYRVVTVASLKRQPERRAIDRVRVHRIHNQRDGLRRDILYFNSTLPKKTEVDLIRVHAKWPLLIGNDSGDWNARQQATRAASSNVG